MEESTEQGNEIKDASSTGFQSVCDSVSDLSSHQFQRYFYLQTPFVNMFSLASSLPDKTDLETRQLRGKQTFFALLKFKIESNLKKLVSDGLNMMMDATENSTTVTTPYEATN